MNAKVEKAVAVFRLFLDLPSDAGKEELTREATFLLKRAASEDCSRENLKYEVSQMLVNRMQQPLDVGACDRVSVALKELAYAPGP